MANTYQFALSYLARREHSVFELRQKLMQKGCDDAAVDEAVVQLKAQGYLNDARFAATLVRSKVARGQGPMKIRYELQQHHIDPTTIETAFAQCEVDWFELAQRVYKKRFGNKPVVCFTEQQKRQRFLYQRGFDVEIIGRVI